LNDDGSETILPCKTGGLKNFVIGHFISGIAPVARTNAAIEAIFNAVIGIFHQAPEIYFVPHICLFYFGGFLIEEIDMLLSGGKEVDNVLLAEIILYKNLIDRAHFPVGFLNRNAADRELSSKTIPMFLSLS
jgi:hypothetical protein